MARTVVESTAVQTITLPVIDSQDTCVITEVKSTGGMGCYIARMNGVDKILDGVLVSDWPWDTSDATDVFCAAFKFGV